MIAQPCFRSWVSHPASTKASAEMIGLVKLPTWNVMRMMSLDAVLKATVRWPRILTPSPVAASIGGSVYGASKGMSEKSYSPQAVTPEPVS